jgi:GxxExxY protein
MTIPGHRWIEHAAHEITGDIISACIAVHRELGPALLEAFYHRALALELSARGVTHDVERTLPVTFRGQVLGHQRIDLVVDERVIVD